MLTVDRTPAVPCRINPDELRRLRLVVGTTLLTCAKTAIQAAVTAAHLAHGEDWTDEARFLLAELGLRTSCKAPMAISR